MAFVLCEMFVVPIVCPMRPRNPLDAASSFQSVADWQWERMTPLRCTQSHALRSRNALAKVLLRDSAEESTVNTNPRQWGRQGRKCPVPSVQSIAPH